MRAPELAESVIVDVPAEQLYRVLGDSGNARKWSVFVHHITATNAGKVPDGAVGSRRRCFVHENETGARWDEELVACEPARLRRITIFDAVGFRLSAEGLVTEQRYEALGSDRTRLTFTLGFLAPSVSLVEAAKFHLAAPYVRSVFRRNLANIKRLAEHREEYSRAHPFVGGAGAHRRADAWAATLTCPGTRPSVSSRTSTSARLMTESPRLVRRAAERPRVWLGEKEYDVAPSPGARFPAYPAREKDFVLEPPRRSSR